MSRQITSNVLGLIGAVTGGVLGYYTFMWICHQGFYGLMIPGALLGLGCGLLEPARLALPRGGLALAAWPSGLYTEWKFCPVQGRLELRLLLNGHRRALRPSPRS